MTRIIIPNSMRELLRYLRRQDIPYRVTKGGHIRVLAPKGIVFLPATPSDRRGIRNAVRELRHYGVNFEVRGKGRKDVAKRLGYLQKNRPVEPAVWELFLAKLQAEEGAPLPKTSAIEKLFPWLFTQHLKDPQKEWTDFGEIRDWWISERPDIYPMTYEQALEGAKAWHKKLAQEKKVYKAAEKDRGKPVLSFPDGSGWYLLASPLPSSKGERTRDTPAQTEEFNKRVKHLMKVGDSLAHCYGSRGGSSNAKYYLDRMFLYTLYDRKGIPRVTASRARSRSRRGRGRGEQEMSEANGFNNRPLSDASSWSPHYVALLRQLKMPVPAVKFMGSVSPEEKQKVLDALTKGRMSGNSIKLGDTKIDPYDIPIQGAWRDVHDALLESRSKAIQGKVLDWEGPHTDEWDSWAGRYKLPGWAEEYDRGIAKIASRLTPSGLPSLVRGQVIGQLRYGPGESKAMDIVLGRLSRSRVKTGGAVQDNVPGDVLILADLLEATSRRGASKKAAASLRDHLPKIISRFSPRERQWLWTLVISQGSTTAYRPQRARRIRRILRPSHLRKRGGWRLKPHQIRALKTIWDVDESQRVGLAHSLLRDFPTQVPGDWLVEILANGKLDLRRYILSLPNLSQTLVKKALDDPRSEVRALALKHPKSSPSMWKKGLQDPSVQVQRIARAAAKGDFYGKWSQGRPASAIRAFSDRHPLALGLFTRKPPRARFMAFLRHPKSSMAPSASVKELIDSAPTPRAWKVGELTEKQLHRWTMWNTRSDRLPGYAYSYQVKYAREWSLGWQQLVKKLAVGIGSGNEDYLQSVFPQQLSKFLAILDTARKGTFFKKVLQDIRVPVRQIEREGRLLNLIKAAHVVAAKFPKHKATTAEIRATLLEEVEAGNIQTRARKFAPVTSPSSRRRMSRRMSIQQRRRAEARRRRRG